MGTACSNLTNTRRRGAPLRRQTSSDVCMHSRSPSHSCRPPRAAVAHYLTATHSRSDMCRPMATHPVSSPRLLFRRNPRRVSVRALRIRPRTPGLELLASRCAARPARVPGLPNRPSEAVLLNERTDAARALSIGGRTPHTRLPRVRPGFAVPKQYCMQCRAPADIAWGSRCPARPASHRYADRCCVHRKSAAQVGRADSASAQVARRATCRSGRCACASSHPYRSSLRSSFSLAVHRTEATGRGFCDWGSWQLALEACSGCLAGADLQ